MTWEHHPRRLPDLDRLDLGTIAMLVRDYGLRHLPLFSKRLMLKVEEAREAYRREDALLDKAREKNENKDRTSGVPEEER